MPLINVTIPVLNEERQLANSIRTLHAYLRQHLRAEFEIVIADNGSTDETPQIARAISGELSGVRHLQLEQRGRGRALKAAWQRSSADVFSYMDVDLSSDLAYFTALIEPLLSRGFEIAIGSRLLKPSLVRRGLQRELMSRFYNHLLGIVFRCGFRDAQCGFKAIRRDAAEKLLDRIEAVGWFFDTELLLLAEWEGFHILELPVAWTDDPDSRVNILQAIREDILGIARMRRTLSARAVRRAEHRYWRPAESTEKTKDLRLNVVEERSAPLS